MKLETYTYTNWLYNMHMTNANLKDIKFCIFYLAVCGLSTFIAV